MFTRIGPASRNWFSDPITIEVGNLGSLFDPRSFGERHIGPFQQAADFVEGFDASVVAQSDPVRIFFGKPSLTTLRSRTGNARCRPGPMAVKSIYRLRWCPILIPHPRELQMQDGPHRSADVLADQDPGAHPRVRSMELDAVPRGPPRENGTGKPRHLPSVSGHGGIPHPGHETMFLTIVMHRSDDGFSFEVPFFGKISGT